MKTTLLTMAIGLLSFTTAQGAAPPPNGPPGHLYSGHDQGATGGEEAERALRAAIHAVFMDVALPFEPQALEPMTPEARPAEGERPVAGGGVLDPMWGDAARPELIVAEKADSAAGEEETRAMPVRDAVPAKDRAARVPCGDDPYEPNDARQRARTLKTSVVEGAICDGDIDWFQIRLSAGQQLEVELVARSGARPTLQLYPPRARTPLNAIESGDRSVRMSHPVKRAGMYRLAISSDVPSTYRLSVSPAPQVKPEVARRTRKARPSRASAPESPAAVKGEAHRRSRVSRAWTETPLS